MTREELQTFLLHQIPLARCMALEVDLLQPDRIRLSAPLSANHNDKGTGFGGSIASLMTLAGWGLLHPHLQRNRTEAELVIHQCQLHYQTPATGRLHAETGVTNPTLETFLTTLQQRRKARIGLEIHLHSDNRLCARMQARFVALLKATSPCTPS